VAFVDEAFIQWRHHPGAYLFAAVILDEDAVAQAADAARAAARGWEFHSTHLYHRGHVGVIESMLDAVEEHAGWTVLVAQTPLADLSDDEPQPPGVRRETARQTSLERLLTYLNAQKVRDVVLDTRGGEAEWQLARQEGRRVPEIDRQDIHTYRRLVHRGDISHRMRLIHVDDRTQPVLWMADAVAWSARRALAVDEPQWWARIADVATVLEASTGAELRIEDNRAAPPDGERGPHDVSQSAHPMLLPAQGPLPGYDPGPDVGDTVGAAGVILTHLLRQADDARAGLHPLRAEQQRRLLAEMRALAERVDDLTRQIQDLRAARPATDLSASDGADVPSPSPHPEAEREIE